MGYLRFALIDAFTGRHQVKFDPPEPAKPESWNALSPDACQGLWWLTFRIGIFDFDHSLLHHAQHTPLVVISFQDWYI